MQIYRSKIGNSFVAIFVRSAGARLRLGAAELINRNESPLGIIIT